MAHSPIRVALLSDGEAGWPAGQPAAARFGEATLLARLLALAGEFDAQPLVCGTAPPPSPLSRGAWLPCRDARDPWAAVAAALAAAGKPLIALGLELPLVPRVWLDYLRRLAVVHWPGGRRPEGAAWGFVPRTGDGWEPRAGLFHPDLAAALASGWRPSPAEAGGGASAGSEGGPYCQALPPAEWREIAGPAGLAACRGPDELAAVLARAGEAGEAAGRRERCRAGRRSGAGSGGRHGDDERREGEAAPGVAGKEPA